MLRVQPAWKERRERERERKEDEKRRKRGEKKVPEKRKEKGGRMKMTPTSLEPFFFPLPLLLRFNSPRSTRSTTSALVSPTMPPPSPPPIPVRLRPSPRHLAGTLAFYRRRTLTLEPRQWVGVSVVSVVAAVEGGGGGEEGRETVVERRWLGDEGESRAREGERDKEKRGRGGHAGRTVAGCWSRVYGRGIKPI